MIIAGLTMFLISLFGGGHETFFLNPDLKKNVKTYVLEEERKDEIFLLMKDSKKEQKVFLKSEKAYIKAYKKLNKDRNSTLEEHRVLVDEYLKEHVSIAAFSIDQEIAMKKLTTPEEWTNIMDAVLEKKDKGKVEKKMNQASQIFFKNLNKSVEDNIAESDSKMKILEIVNKLKIDLDEFIPIAVELSYKNHEAMRDYNAPKEAYESSAIELINLRKQLSEDYLELRFQLLELTSEKEWKSIVKEYNKLIS